jgi:hypothetical protein
MENSVCARFLLSADTYSKNLGLTKSRQLDVILQLVDVIIKDVVP